MCNLYSQTRSQDAMRRLFDGIEDLTGNLPMQTEIYPDYSAPHHPHGPSGTGAGDGALGLAHAPDLP